MTEKPPSEQPAQDWKPMHEAPRADAHGQPVSIRLFLPGVKYQSNGKGHPVAGSIEHGECVGIWEKSVEAWLDATTRQIVYPSQWQSL